MIIQGADSKTGPSFTWGNRIARTVWQCCWILLFRPSPRPFHRWRAMLLRLFGARIGRDVHVYPDVRIWAPWQLTIGDRVGIADGVTLYNMAPIDIGRNSVVSQGAHLCAGSHDIDSDNFQLITAPIRLQADVWICAEAFLGPGAHVAEGCVVGARAVVMKPIGEPWTVWAGNPARRLRARKSQASSRQ